MILQTPDGVVKKKHFRAVIRGDGGPKHLGLKIARKLTPDHLDPKFFQKMNNQKAFDVKLAAHGACFLAKLQASR